MKPAVHNLFRIINIQVSRKIAITVCMLFSINTSVLHANELNEKLFHAMFSHTKLNEIDGLIKKGADVNYKNKNGTPVLHHALRHAKPIKILKRIVDAGADLNISDNTGVTVFHLLSERTATNEFVSRDKNTREKRESELLKFSDYIFKKGANPNVADKHGKTPLYKASIKMSKWLLEKKLDPNARATIDRWRDGVTPLMTYAHDGNYELVKLLLENDADPHLKDYNGFSAACYARNRLLDYGYPPYSRRSKMVAVGYVSIEKILSKFGVGKEMPTIVPPPKEADWSIKRSHIHSLKCKVNGRPFRR